MRYYGRRYPYHHAWTTSGQPAFEAAEPAEPDNSFVADYTHALHRVVFDPITDALRLISGCGKVLGVICGLVYLLLV